MTRETSRPVRVSEDCSGGIETCFRCEPGSYLWTEGGEMFCVTDAPDTKPAFLLGALLLGAGVVLSRRRASSGLGWLGDDPTPPSSFDPSRSNRAAYLRTHIAKKFWGATVLASQAAISMDKLAMRVRSSNPEAAGEATAISRMLQENVAAAGSLARKYDEPWVMNRLPRSGIKFEVEK